MWASMGGVYHWDLAEAESSCTGVEVCALYYHRSYVPVSLLCSEDLRKSTSTCESWLATFVAAYV
jgi:hypothetical protein